MRYNVPYLVCICLIWFCICLYFPTTWFCIFIFPPPGLPSTAGCRVHTSRPPSFAIGCCPRSCLHCWGRYSEKKVFNHICYCPISYLNSCRKHLVWFVTCYIEVSVKYTTSCFPCSWCEKPSINLSTKCSNCLKGEAVYKSSWTIWLFLSLCASQGITLSASKEEIGNTSENWFHKLFSTHSHICGDCMVMMMKK